MQRPYVTFTLDHIVFASVLKLKLTTTLHLDKEKKIRLISIWKCRLWSNAKLNTCTVNGEENAKEWRERREMREQIWTRKLIFAEAEPSTEQNGHWRALSSSSPSKTIGNTCVGTFGARWEWLVTWTRSVHTPGRQNEGQPLCLLPPHTT